MFEIVFKYIIYFISIILSIILFNHNKKLFNKHLIIFGVIVILIELIFIAISNLVYNEEYFNSDHPNGLFDINYYFPYLLGSYIFICMAYLLFKLKKYKLSDSQISDYIKNNIHPNDIHLIDKSDIMVNYNLNDTQIFEIEKEDTISRIKEYENLRSTGLNKKDALKGMLKTVPVFYTTIDERNEMPNVPESPFIFSDDDLRLPICLRKRFYHFVYLASRNNKKADILRSYINNSSFANSAIRKMIIEKIF